MTSDPIFSRDAAWALLTEWTKSDSLRKHALAVEAAVRGGHTTTDLGGKLGTKAVGDWIAAHLKKAN